jgi:hypothetical protein
MNTENTLDPMLDPDDLRREPLQRLMASRARLRAELIPARRFGAAASSSMEGDLPRRARALWRLLISRQGAGAVFSSAASLLKTWWVRQPWHATSELLGHAVVEEVSPWVRRHPVAAVALGAGAGAAVAMVRPWRWQVVNAQSRRMGRSVGRWAVHQLTQAPVQMAIAAAIATWLERRQPSGSD